LKYEIEKNIDDIIATILYYNNNSLDC